MKIEPKAGNGNHSDKDNNIGINDHDTSGTAYITNDKTTPIYFKVTNNGTEALTKLQVSDKTIESNIDVKDIKWTFNGKTLSTNKDGYLTLDDKVLTIQPGEFIEGTGTLPVLPDGVEHGDEASVVGVGVKSGKKVGDEDKWYGKHTKPSIDVEKSNNKEPQAGNGNNTDKDNNIGINDHDTAGSAYITGDGQETKIFFKITNNGTEALTKLTVKDQTISGNIDVKSIKWTYKGKELSTDKNGYLTLNGKMLVLQPSESIEGTGVLPALPEGVTHGDNVTVGGVGVDSGKKVGDHDKWYGRRPQPKLGTTATNKTDGSHTLPMNRVVAVSDAVTYTNLTPGQVYHLYGVLMDKQTGKPVMVNGKEVVGEKTFTPTKASGVVDVEFTFDTTGLSNHDLVAFETLTLGKDKGGKVVAVHKDINSASQTDHVTSPLSPVIPNVPQAPSTPQTPDTPAGALPKTGDTGMGSLIALIGLFILGLATLLGLRRRAR